MGSQDTIMQLTIIDIGRRLHIVTILMAALYIQTKQYQRLVGVCC
jgi:hypothetical protein